MDILLTQSYMDNLASELSRVIEGQGDNFTTSRGVVIRGATETDVIKHLTSRRDFVEGRQYRFPGIGNGWNFSSGIGAVGYQIVSAKNRRGQTCNVVTLFGFH